MLVLQMTYSEFTTTGWPTILATSVLLRNGTIKSPTSITTNSSNAPRIQNVATNFTQYTYKIKEQENGNHDDLRV